MLPESVSRLVGALKKTGRRRLTLEMVRQEFASACPELAEQPDRRMRLAEALRGAANTGEIQLPKQMRSWDRTGGATLPGFVVVTTPRPPASPAIAPGYTWHPLLAFAASERNHLRLQSAKRINEWLKGDPDLTLIVPIKERSLEIFGDEKRLDQLRAGTTSLYGQLSLAALGCRVCPIPLPFEPGPESARGQPVLIVENNDTWASFAHWNRGAGRYAAVAYAGGGHGKSLAYDETFIDELLERFGSTELLYFGDIDPAGLHIASGAAERRARRRALPLQPAELLYAWLLAHGTRTALQSAQRGSSADVTWLPEVLCAPVEALFAEGRRIPQESLGTRVLMTGAIHI